MSYLMHKIGQASKLSATILRFALVYFVPCVFVLKITSIQIWRFQHLQLECAVFQRRINYYFPKQQPAIYALVYLR